MWSLLQHVLEGIFTIDFFFLLPPLSPLTCTWWIKTRGFFLFFIIPLSLRRPPAENWPEDIRGKWNARQWLRGFWMWVKINVKAGIKCTIPFTKNTLWCLILEDKDIKKKWLKSQIWCSNLGGEVTRSALFNKKKKKRNNWEPSYDVTCSDYINQTNQIFLMWVNQLKCYLPPFSKVKNPISDLYLTNCMAVPTTISVPEYQQWRAVSFFSPLPKITWGTQVCCSNWKRSQNDKDPHWLLNHFMWVHVVLCTPHAPLRKWWSVCLYVFFARRFFRPLTEEPSPTQMDSEHTWIW